MSISVYVACAGVQIPRARAAMTALRMAGLRVTVDWTQHHRPTAALSEAEARDAAYEDVQGIVEADVVLVLSPPAGVRSDAIAELGIAIGLAHGDAGYRRLVVVGSRVESGIFGALCDEEHPT